VGASETEFTAMSSRKGPIIVSDDEIEFTAMSSRKGPIIVSDDETEFTAMSSKKGPIYVGVDEEQGKRDKGFAKKRRKSSKSESESIIDLSDADDDVPPRAPFRGTYASELDLAEIANLRGKLDLQSFQQTVRDWKSSGNKELAVQFSKLLEAGELLEDGIIMRWMTHIRKEQKFKSNMQCHLLAPGFFQAIDCTPRELIGRAGHYLERVKLFGSDNKKDTFLFVPVCYQVHWILCVVDIKNFTMTIYDSLKDWGWKVEGKDMRAHDYIYKKIRFWLESRYVAETRITHYPHFKSKPPSEDVPRQETLDCGSFICMYMSYIISGLDFDFGQKDMPLLKRWMFGVLQEDPHSVDPFF
jgi:Ulp1 family protease